LINGVAVLFIKIAMTGRFFDYGEKHAFAQNDMASLYKRSGAMNGAEGSP